MRTLRLWTPILLAAIVLTTTPFGDVARANAQGIPVDAVGRLIVDGNRLCTAFVVRSIERRSTVPFGIPRVTYENWIVSAGHCFGQRLVFHLGGTKYSVTRVIAFSTGDSLGYDILVASFPTPALAPTLEPAFGLYPQTGDTLMLIGYGGKALMVRVDPLLEYNASGLMQIDGYASSGNSGGPVLIPGTRRVVGIEIATTVDRPSGAPSLLCVIAKCGVKPPYVAVHIDKLRGLVSVP